MRNTAFYFLREIHFIIQYGHNLNRQRSFMVHRKIISLFFVDKYSIHFIVMIIQKVI